MSTREDRVNDLFGISRVTDYTEDLDNKKASFSLDGHFDNYSLREFKDLELIFATEDIDFEIQPEPDYTYGEYRPEAPTAKVGIVVRNIGFNDTLDELD